MNPRHVNSLTDFKVLFKDYKSDGKFTSTELKDLTKAQASCQQAFLSDGRFSRRESMQLVNASFRLSKALLYAQKIKPSGQHIKVHFNG